MAITNQQCVCVLLINGWTVRQMDVSGAPPKKLAYGIFSVIKLKTFLHIW